MEIITAATAAVVAAGASPAAAQFNDQLVQAPKLAAPERGSVQGALADVGFTAAELARGGFRLPLPIQIPQDRGPMQAGVIPAYSPDGGLTEWGMGWSVELAIKRHRLVGELDYTHDDLVSPWGRLRPGNDGKLYPAGLASPIRIAALGADYVATGADGTQYRFSAASGVTTSRGAYSWQLTEVVSLEGDRTTLEWIKNASGRPFLARVTWGGRGTVAQYELTPTYESLAMPFVDHATGTQLDRRITGLAISVRDATGGSLSERWHYALGYREAPFGPAYYLETVQRRFASGELEPAMVYRYDLDDARLPTAALEHYTGLDAVLGAFGDNAIQPHRASLFDLDADGRPDLEHAAALTLLQHTDAGWVQSALPPTTGEDPRCRPAESSDNKPRSLARMTADIGAPHVVYTRRLATEPLTSQVLVCDRLGHPAADLVVPDDWQLGPNIRLADIDRDRRPDLVRISRSGVDILRNESDAQGIRFTALPRFTWNLDFAPSVSWLHDVNGDGNLDVTIRSTSGLWVLFGLGNYQWTTTPELFHFVTQADDTLGSVNTYQVTFVDANKDGLADVLLSKGINVWLYSNRGDLFREVPVAGFRSMESSFGLPIVADLTGDGNTEVVFPTLGTSYVVRLAVPSTGLLTSADDGAGTVARFRYARSAPRAGIEQRLTVLDQLTIESSGYDTVTYSYTYGTPVLHSIGKQLVGYAAVTKHSPLLTEQVAFLNDDDVAGLVTLAEDTDDRTPGIIRFVRRTYDDVRSRDVRWLRPAVVESGHRNSADTIRLATTTTYLSYERDVCPTAVATSSSAGQKLQLTTLASIAAIPDELHCLSGSERVVGTHADSSLDFNYFLDLTRNSLGQLTRATQYNALMAPLVLQDIGYRADHRVETLARPGQGTTTATYDAAGRRTEVVDPTGIATRVTSIDPISDQLLGIETARPGAAVNASFVFDDRERLQAAWDDVSGSSAIRPLASYSYRDATSTAPGRIDTRNLADALTGTVRRTVAVVAADGEALTEGVWIGDRFSFGESSIESRNTLARRSAFIGTLTESALAAMTSADLRALGTPLADSFLAGFGHETQLTTTHQASVTGTVSTGLALTATELVKRVQHPGGFIAEAGVDAAGHVVRRTDEINVVHRYTYDVLDRLVRVDTPDGAHIVEFDAFGRPARVAREGIGAMTYAYDPASSLLVRKQRLDRFGAVIETNNLHYDAIGRMIEVEQTLGLAATPERELHFDHDGQLGDATIPGQLGRQTRVRGDGWERREVFDALGRPIEQRTKLIGWREVASDKMYRADGSVESDTLTVTDASGAVRFSSTKETEIDALGRASAVRVDGDVLYTLAYDAEGRLARADFASGEAIVFDYDPVTHRRSGHRVEAPDSTGGVHWTRDPRGLISSETYDHDATSVRREYTYDGRGALLSATTPTEVKTYTYTPSGLLSTIGDNASLRSLARGTGALVADPDYTWDDAGRIAGKGEWTFDYGAHGQISRARRLGRQIDFVYDEANHRLLKRIDGAPVRAEVGGAVITEDHVIELVAIGGVTVGVLDNGAFTALLTDPRGTPFVGPDGTPGMASPYGVRASHLGYSEVIDYARLAWDPDLDLVRMGVRDYDAKLGQFLTPDPLFFENLDQCKSSPLECSLYGYVVGNPISFVDSTGLGVREWAAGVCGVIVGGFDAITFGGYSKLMFSEDQMSTWHEVPQFNVGYRASETATEVVMLASGVAEAAAAIKAGQFAFRAMQLADGSTVVVAAATGRAVAVVGATSIYAAWTTTMMMSAGRGGGGGRGAPPAPVGPPKPKEILDPSTTPIYRGGKDFTLKSGEGKLVNGKMTNDVRGPSLDLSADNVRTHGTPVRIKSLPDELHIVQKGKPGHYEIHPKDPTTMTRERFQELVNKVEYVE